MRGWHTQNSRNNGKSQSRRSPTACRIRFHRLHIDSYRSFLMGPGTVSLRRLTSYALACRFDHLILFRVFYAFFDELFIERLFIGGGGDGLSLPSRSRNRVPAFILLQSFLFR